MAYVIFDTETTGLSPRMGDRIVEIAGIRVVNGHITDETFSSLINPHRLMSAGAQRVNRISNDQLLSAPEASEVIPQFLDFVGSDTLVAHNAEFDLSFLRYEMDLIGMDPERLPHCICTLELARGELAHLTRHNLDALIHHFGLETDRRHRALDDVRATAQIFVELHQEEPTLF